MKSERITGDIHTTRDIRLPLQVEQNVSLSAEGTGAVSFAVCGRFLCTFAADICVGACGTRSRSLLAEP